MVNRIKKEERKFLAEFVYGGMDGAITTFAVVSGVVGASLSSTIILILGFANLFVDGFSMASANYLSEKSERENHKKNHKHGKRPVQSAIATFISFLLMGLIPLFPFVFPEIATIFSVSPFVFSAIFTGFAFLIIGGIRGDVVGKNKAKSALETFFIGTIAAVIAFSLGWFLQGLV